VERWRPCPRKCVECLREAREEKEQAKAMEIDEDMQAVGADENEPF